MTHLEHAQEIEGTFIPSNADQSKAIAEIFCRMFADEQAAFLDHVAALSEGWQSPACFQWRSMEDTITPRARELLKAMHEHSEKVPA